MTNFDSFNTGHRDTVAHHATGAEPLGEGERDYVEHVKSQKLSGFERLVVVGALVLLGAVGLTGHFQTPVTDQMTTSAIAAPVSDATPHHHQGLCREYSPYAEKNC